MYKKTHLIINTRDETRNLVRGKKCKPQIIRVKRMKNMLKLKTKNVLKNRINIQSILTKF